MTTTEGENVGVASYTVSSHVAPANQQQPQPPPPAPKELESTDSDHEVSTAVLEIQLQRLRDKSNELSQELTQRLASSESGQNLLQIGPSLSTLPPDISSLLMAATPLLEDLTTLVNQNQSELDRIQTLQHSIETATKKAAYAKECVQVWQELMHAEESILLLIGHQANLFQETVHLDSEQGYETLEQMASLEQCAQTTLGLLQQLEQSHAVLSSITKQTSKSSGVTSFTTGASSSTPASEKAHFVNRLSSRIHTLETNTTKCLLTNLDSILLHIRTHSTSSNQVHWLSMGHCLRGLALLGKCKDAESVFARVAIMPLIRSKVSIGRMDEGGARGECAGLFSLLDDIVCCVSQTYGPVLVLSASLFPHGEIDLVTSGVWIPLATTFMADPAIKMAIFSPGIASILQANFMALHLFLSELAERLLNTTSQTNNDETKCNDDDDRPHDLVSMMGCTRVQLHAKTIQDAQIRLYRHLTTTEFEKKWNLPIYYQLRFGECCTRLNRAIARVQQQGWSATVFTGSKDQEAHIRSQVGLEVPLFMELYDILLFLWQPNVCLRPLTHRFLRGAVQLLGRVLSFVKDGLEKQTMFGGGDVPEFSWVDNPSDLATVAWDLTVLESAMSHEYYDIVVAAVAPNDNDSFDNTREEIEMLQQLIHEVLVDATEGFVELIEKSWNDLIATHLTLQCCQPLSAVKGVAATYRMTNRPPPTQASPFVPMMLRPLLEFDAEFANRTSPQIGVTWKEAVVAEVSQKYSVAVEELLETVRRTEEALLSRRGAAMMARRTGMTDGDKVKLQLLLDFIEFQTGIRSLGLLDGMHLDGVAKLQQLTEPARPLLDQV